MMGGVGGGTTVGLRFGYGPNQRFRSNRGLKDMKWRETFSCTSEFEGYFV